VIEGLRPSRANSPLAGAGYFLRGLGLIWQPGVRRFVVVPLAINVAFFTVAVWLGLDRLTALIERTLPGWLIWLEWLLVPVLLLVAVVAGFFLFNLVANLVAAPFNGLLAEAVERRIGGRVRPGGGWKGLVRDLALTLRSELRKAAYVLVRAVPLLVLMLVPGINVLASAVWLLLGAWMLAVTYADYPMANHGLSFREQRPLLARHRLLALGFGGCVMAALAIPLLNFLVIPAAVAGATVMWHERLAPQGPAGGGQRARGT